MEINNIQLLDVVALISDLTEYNLSRGQDGFEVLPRNEAQCRELSQYAGSELVRVWREITANIPPHKITARSIHEYLHPEEEIEEDTTIKLPKKLYSCILSLAIDAGMSIVELLESTFIGYTEPVPIGTTLRWGHDLRNLVLEHSSIPKE